MATTKSSNTIPKQTKNVILVKNFNKVLYALAVRTTAQNVYTDSSYTYTVSEMLSDIADAIVTNSKRVTGVSEKLDALLEDCPAQFNSIRDIWHYVNVENDDPKSAIRQLIDTKQSMEEGKGLSTHDLDDLLYEKIVNDYTKEQIDEKFRIIITDTNRAIVKLNNKIKALEAKNNILMTAAGAAPIGTKEGDFWFQQIDDDDNN